MAGRAFPLPRSQLLDAESQRLTIMLRSESSPRGPVAKLLLATSLPLLCSSLAIAFPSTAACNLPSATYLLRFCQLSKALTTASLCVPSSVSSPQTVQGAHCKLKMGCHWFLFSFKLVCILYIGDGGPVYMSAVP